MRTTKNPMNRANKNAAGMQKTWDRSHHSQMRKLDDTHYTDLLRLVVHGSMDKLTGLGFGKERINCPCCGSRQKGKLRLTDSGRLRLKKLRQKRQ